MRLPKVGRTLHPEPARDDLTMGGHQQHAVFLRGLSLGALVGAAIAGSALWDGRRTHRARGLIGRGFEEQRRRERVTTR